MKLKYLIASWLLPDIKNLAYTAAGMGRRAKSWYAPGLSPNTALTADLSKLINRSRVKWFNDLGHLVKHNSAVNDEVESDKAA